MRGGRCCRAEPRINGFRIACACLALLLPIAATPFAAAANKHFAAPADTFTDRKPLNDLKAALDQKNYADAAGLLDALLAEDGDKLMAAEPAGGLIAVTAWIDTLAARAAKCVGRGISGEV